EVLGNSWIDSVMEHLGDVNIIIKPHPVTAEKFPQWMELWRQAQDRHQHVYLVEDTHASVYPYCRHADVLLSDASSVIFYFLALDRPIVLVGNPAREQEAVFFDRDGPEWKWRDVGIEIEKVSEVAPSLSRALEHPNMHSAKRLEYAQRVFGDLRDGRSAE